MNNIKNKFYFFFPKYWSDGTRWLIMGLLIWFIPTAIFGFQDNPTSWVEKTTDIIGIILIFQGILMNCFGAVRLKNEINIDANLVKFISDHYKRPIKKQIKK